MLKRKKWAGLYLPMIFMYLSCAPEAQDNEIDPLSLLSGGKADAIWNLAPKLGFGVTKTASITTDAVNIFAMDLNAADEFILDECGYLFPAWKAECKNNCIGTPDPKKCEFECIYEQPYNYIN